MVFSRLIIAKERNMGFKRFFIIPAFALIFGAFGVIDTAYSRIGDDAICFLLEEHVDSTAHGSSSHEGSHFTIEFSYGTVSGTGMCSQTSFSNPGVIAIPSSASGNFCWCHLDSVNTDGEAVLNASPFMVSAGSVNDCQEECAGYCGEALANNDDEIRSTLYGNKAARFCVAGCTSLAEIDPDTNFSVQPDDTDYSVPPNWSAFFDGGAWEVRGTSLCSITAGRRAEPGTPNETTPGSECWCRATSYYNDDHDTTYYASSSTWFSADAGFGSTGECQSGCAQFCAEDLVRNGLMNDISSADFCMAAPYGLTVTYNCGTGTGTPTDSNGPYAPGTMVTMLADSACTPPNNQLFRYWDCGTDNYVANDEFEIYADMSCTAVYGQYTVGYNCGIGSGTPPDDLSGPYLSGTDVTTVTAQANTCTAPTGQTFSGWDCNGNLVNAGGTFTITDHTYCAARYGYPFTITTTSLNSGDTFVFSLTARGTFYVDCGEGGRLSGSDVSGDKIATRNGGTYTCTYSTGGVKTIRFGGLATEYPNSSPCSGTNVLDFYGAPIASISGDLSAIFPAYGTNIGQYPGFYFTFAGQTHLTSIPNTLFQGYTNNVGACMFAGTFSDCTGLASLPTELFKNITGTANNMFESTFYGCSGLTGSVPPTLFAGLINGGSNYAQYMMADIFEATGGLATNLTGCPSGTTVYNTGYESYWVDSENSIDSPNHYVSCTTAVSGAITYSCGTGSAVNLPSNVTATPGSAFTPAAANVCNAPNGKRLVGWTVSGTNPAETVAPNVQIASWPYSGDRTLTASYADEYTLSYSCNGGTGNVPTSQTLINGETFTTRANTCSKTGHDFAGWTWNSNGTGTTLNANASATYSYSENKTLYAKWNPNSYTVTYSCSPGSGSVANATAYYNQSFTPAAANSCTPPTGQTFMAWAVSGTDYTRKGGSSFSWAWPQGKALTAIYSPFSVTTTNLPANSTFSFTMSAQGTFYVDCGEEGATLTGTDSDGFTITKGDTAEYTYTCTYPTAGVKTISFGGLAIGYESPGNDTAAISFYPGRTKLASMAGDLSAIFPSYGSGAGESPEFYRTFAGCSNLTAIPGHLFEGYTDNAGEFMFNETFKDCTGLTSIPDTLFGDITTGTNHLFYHTFDGCTGLTALPLRLFQNVDSDAEYLFAGTFANCTGLSGYIPSTLFSSLVLNGSPDSTEMMTDMFDNVDNMDYACPNGTSDFNTGYEHYWGGRVSCEALGEVSLTYSCSPGSMSIPPVNTSVYNGQTITTPAANTCTPSVGQTFSGWSCNGTPVSAGGSYTLSGNTTCTAQYTINYPFSITTTNLANGATFQFNISAYGTFYVDCGTGGTLSGPGSSGNTITKNNANTVAYTCTYTGTTSERTIQFGGLASAYNTNNQTPAITFQNNTSVKAVTGNMSTVFPYLGSGSGQVPSFQETFHGCTSLNSIGSNLFASLTSGGPNMFAGTFGNCTALTTIPSGLFDFANNVSGTTDMFSGTFSGCTSLTTIPSTLFAHITSSAQSLFQGTFSGCTALTAIPSGLFNFANTVTGAQSMFSGTFAGCTGLGTNGGSPIPASLFSRVTSGATSMFAGTFSSCNHITQIPSELFNFGGNNVNGATDMFGETFSACTSLTSLPSGLFAKITSAANSMFSDTFSGCTGLTGYIPPNLFAGLIASGSPTATNMMNSTFNNTGSLATTCPSGTQTYTTGYESYWVDAPNNVTSPNHYVACELLSTFTITYYDTDCTTVLTGLSPTTYTAGDAVDFPTATKPGYTNSGWCRGCGTNCGALGWQAGAPVTGNQSVYVSGWTPNNITVNFDSSSTSCTYDGTLNVPTPQSRPGYVFVGWNLCTLSGLNTSADGTINAFGYLSNNGQSSSNTSTYNLTTNGTWAQEFSYGTIKGKSICSAKVGNTGSDTWPQNNSSNWSATESELTTAGSGTYCWCRVTDLIQTNGNQCNFSSPRMTFYYNLTGVYNCARDCAMACESGLAASPNFRRAMYGQ